MDISARVHGGNVDAAVGGRSPPDAGGSCPNANKKAIDAILAIRRGCSSRKTELDNTSLLPSNRKSLSPPKRKVPFHVLLAQSRALLIFRGFMEGSYFCLDDLVVWQVASLS